MDVLNTFDPRLQRTNLYISMLLYHSTRTELVSEQEFSMPQVNVECTSVQFVYKWKQKTCMQWSKKWLIPTLVWISLPCLYIHQADRQDLTVHRRETVSLPQQWPGMTMEWTSMTRPDTVHSCSGVWLLLTWLGHPLHTTDTLNMYYETCQY